MKDNPKAFLFDLNGTMIDDMHYHLDVWFDVISKDLGSTLSKEEVRGHMYGTNFEVLTRIFGEGRFSKAEVEIISQAKEESYQKIYKPHLDLIPGLFSFLRTADQNQISMAVCSAALPFNIDFVMDNLNIRQYFKEIISGVDVQESKPHPEVFLKAATLLGVQPDECTVFEDAPKGVEAALRAGMQCVVITTMHQQNEFKDYNNILLFIKDYNDPGLSTRLFITS